MLRRTWISCSLALGLILAACQTVAPPLTHGPGTQQAANSSFKTSSVSAGSLVGGYLKDNIVVKEGKIYTGVPDPERFIKQDFSTRAYPSGVWDSSTSWAISLRHSAPYSAPLTGEEHKSAYIKVLDLIRDENTNLVSAPRIQAAVTARDGDGEDIPGVRAWHYFQGFYLFSPFIPVSQPNAPAGALSYSSDHVNPFTDSFILSSASVSYSMATDFQADGHYHSVTSYTADMSTYANGTLTLKAVPCPGQSDADLQTYVPERCGKAIIDLQASGPSVVRIGGRQDPTRTDPMTATAKVEIPIILYTQIKCPHPHGLSGDYYYDSLDAVPIGYKVPGNTCQLCAGDERRDPQNPHLCVPVCPPGQTTVNHDVSKCASPSPSPIQCGTTVICGGWPGPSGSPSHGPSPVPSVPEPNPTPGPSSSPTPSPNATSTPPPTPTPTPTGGGGDCTQEGYRKLGDECVFCPTEFGLDAVKRCHLDLSLKVEHFNAADHPNDPPPVIFSPRDVNGHFDKLNFFR